MDFIGKLERELAKLKDPKFSIGDTVDVHYRIREGDKDRIQVFNGTVIAIKGRGIRKNFIVRRIVQGEGVERTFPLHSPNIADVVVTRKGEGRRAKLYYLRSRVGKATKVRELLAGNEGVVVPGEDAAPAPEAPSAAPKGAVRK